MVTFPKTILEILGDLQLCAGQSSRYEDTIHTLSLILNEENCDVILRVDAGIAFNKIKFKFMLETIQVTCPIITTYVNNSYNHQAILFIPSCDEIISGEGTMKIDSAAVTLYGLDSLLLLDAVSAQNTKHAAYADN